VIARMLKLFAALSSLLSVPRNYFNSLAKLFLGLYLAKFLDTSATVFRVLIKIKV